MNQTCKFTGNSSAVAEDHTNQLFWREDSVPVGVEVTTSESEMGWQQPFYELYVAIATELITHSSFLNKTVPRSESRSKL